MILNKKGTKKRKHSKSHIVADLDHELTDVKESNQTQSLGKVHEIFEEQYVSINLEEKLKSAGILAREDFISSEYCVQVLFTANFDPTIFKNASSLVSTNAPQINKNRETLLSLFHGDAFRLFVGLVIMWKMRSVSEEKVVPWICHILTHHNYSIMSQKASKQILEGLHKMTRFKSLSVGSLSRLSGSLQLITAQIAKAGGDKDADNILPSEPLNESDNDEDVYAVLYNEEEELSKSSGDDE
ncbi:hypothetical protein ZOSMA_1G00990 [Zostera marina]|uniref:Small-subunit processome Utp12 domain-containing protein n=1 Tax=Zostera marina TaxID=29655 RepID=A0A0K9PM59_ZOSMR|nr:hypothetical protein ZOSMA_1G00990 [Zostera marina]